MSSSTAGSPSSTRSNLGPLTTTFVPPAQCLSPVFDAAGGDSEMWLNLGRACAATTLVDTTTCWPSISTSFFITPGADFHGLGFYSPGLICPSGYSAACSAVQLANGAPSPIVGGSSFSFAFPLEPEETAIGCCPLGYYCDASISGTVTAQACVMDIGPWNTEIGFCGTNSIQSTSSITIPGSFEYEDSFNDSHTSVQVNVSTAYIFGPMYQMVFKAADLFPTSSMSESASSAPASSAPTALSDDSLSTGGKIALGVALPIGLIAIGFLTATVWLRRRKQSHASFVTQPWRNEPTNKSDYTAGHKSGKYWNVQEIGPREQTELHEFGSGNRAELHTFGPSDQLGPRELMDRTYR